MNSCNQLYHDRTIITDRTVRNKDLDTTINKAYLAGVPIPNSRYLHSTVSQKSSERRANNVTETKRGLYSTISIIHKGFITNKAGNVS